MCEPPNNECLFEQHKTPPLMSDRQPDSADSSSRLYSEYETHRNLTTHAKSSTSKIMGLRSLSPVVLDKRNISFSVCQTQLNSKSLGSRLYELAQSATTPLEVASKSHVTEKCISSPISSNEQNEQNDITTVEKKQCRPRSVQLPAGRSKLSQVTFDLNQNQCVEYKRSDRTSSPGKRIYGYISSSGDTPGEGTQDSRFRQKSKTASQTNGLSVAQDFTSENVSHLNPSKFGAYFNMKKQWTNETGGSTRDKLLNYKNMTNLYENEFLRKHASSTAYNMELQSVYQQMIGNNITVNMLTHQI